MLLFSIKERNCVDLDILLDAGGRHWVSGMTGMNASIDALRFWQGYSKQFLQRLA